MLAAILIAAVLTASASTPTPDPAQGSAGAESPAAKAEATSASGLDWIAAPVITYNADAGFGFGAFGTFQKRTARENDWQLTAWLQVTRVGQKHWVHFKAPHFLGSSVCVWLRADYAVDRLSPYYGLGNDSGSTSSDRSFVYGLRSPSGRAGLSVPLGAGISTFALMSWRDLYVEASPHSQLAFDRPIGFDGGHQLQGLAGFYLDRRDSESNPHHGWYLEFSARAQAQETGDAFAGGNWTFKGFWGLGERLVLASRLAVDVLSKDAPFHEQAIFSGLDAFDGVGGQSSVRGVPKSRYIGRLKALGSLELRAHVLDATVLDRPVGLGMVGFLDAGRVWMLEGNDGPLDRVHPGCGLGLRAWSRSLVARLDLGSSPERLLSVYALLGHFF